MQLWFARVDPKTHRMVVERPPYARIEVVLETRSLLVHDFAHWAVETALEAGAGFYGHLAAGRSLEALREPLADPEAQAVLPLVSGDFAEFLFQAADRKLNPGLLKFNEGWSVTLVMATRDYPTKSGSGDVIMGLDQIDTARVYHAGTMQDQDAAFTTNGGRVLAVSHTGDTREEARNSAYEELRKLSFTGAQIRRDIATTHFE